MTEHQPEHDLGAGAAAGAGSAAPGTGAGGEEQRIESLSALSEKVDRLAAAVARLVPASHQEAEQRTEQRLERPATIEEQVRAELGKARQAEQEQAEQRQWREQLEAKVARVAERPPAPPARRATRLLGWGDGRG